MKRSPSARSPATTPRPDERLALPGLGPAVEVRRVPVQVASQPSLATFGSEAEVERRHAFGGARAVHQVQQRLGHRFAHEVISSVVDQEQVEITGVRHLGAAESAHPHDRERHDGVDHIERRLEECFVHGGQGAPRGDHVVDVEKVPSRDANVLVLAEPHELGPAPAPRRRYGAVAHPPRTPGHHGGSG